MPSKLSIFWILLIALVVTSAIPLSAMAYNAIRTTETGIEQELQNQLVERTNAHAATINEQFREFSLATELVAAQAKAVLLASDGAKLSPEQVEQRLTKYQPDQNGVLGLDQWYREAYLPASGDDRQSNVFLNNKTALNDQIKYAIAASEDLNPLFESIRSSKLGTQWIYLTLPSGMMRLYPWQDNSGYPTDWEPQTISFYTIATAVRDPDRRAVWTQPYNDFAGAGLMVTNSAPIYDGDNLIGVLSHDLRIKDLQTQVLGFKLGKAGFAFLIDSQGNIIAHKDYAPEKTPLGEELSIKLADQDPAMTGVVHAMLAQPTGARTFVDESGQTWHVAFSRIEETDWHLGMLLPRREIIQPALDIAGQVQGGAALFAAFVLVVSLLLARRIARPILQLSNAAQIIGTSVDQETLSEGDLAQIRGPQEISRLVAVFSEMVRVLHARMVELKSIYAIGQAITSNLEYDQTLQAILTAVQQVVGYDAAEIAVSHGGDWVVGSWRGAQGFRDTTGDRVDKETGLEGALFKDPSPMLVPTVDEPSEFTRRLDPKAEATSVRSFLGIPLTVRGRLLGTLTLVARKAGHFDEDDKRQLSNLAAQASVAIDNAIQVRERENVLKAQIRELKIEIDEAKKTKQVQEIVETDYFRELKDRAGRLRASRGQDSAGS